MRTYLIAAALIISTPTAFAQQVAQVAPEHPAVAAPAASASFEQRDDWCRQYAAWFIARLPAAPTQAADPRPTQRVETELNSCKLDPQQYEQQTMAELEASAEAHAG